MTALCTGGPAHEPGGARPWLTYAPAQGDPHGLWQGHSGRPGESPSGVGFYGRRACGWLRIGGAGRCGVRDFPEFSDGRDGDARSANGAACHGLDLSLS
jgi:hypothetical protein